MLLCAKGDGPLSAKDRASQKKIRDLLAKWAEDFNAKKSAQVCAIYAPDLIARSPHAPDKDYEAMCDHLKEIIKNKEITCHYDSPTVEEILISGDLAVVRLCWHLKIKKDLSEKSIKELGINVFKRQKDGKWKISISYTFENP